MDQKIGLFWINDILELKNFPVYHYASLITTISIFVATRCMALFTFAAGHYGVQCECFVTMVLRGPHISCDIGISILEKRFSLRIPIHQWK